MFTVYLMSRVFYRTGSPLNSLAAASFVILVWRPSELFNPSFQLTFLSILAIAGFGFPLIERLRSIGTWTPTAKRPFPPRAGKPIRIFSEVLYWDEREWRRKLEKTPWKCEIEKTLPGGLINGTRFQKSCRYLFEVVCVTFSVQLFLLPILVYNFHQIGSASLISNLFAGIAVAIQNAAALIAVVISIFDLESAKAFSAGVSGLTEFSIVLQSIVSRFVLVSSRVPVYSGAMRYLYAVYFLPLFGMLWALNSWNPFAGSRRHFRKYLIRICLFSLLSIGILILFHPSSEQIQHGRLRVDFLDVGQGDSTFVTFPHGQTLLVDGGGLRDYEDGDSVQMDRRGIGEKVVSEFLWEKGFDKIDVIISTHPDADHINGLIDVVRNFDVSIIYAAARFEEVPEYRELAAAAAERGVVIRILGAGMTLMLDGVSLEVFHPVPGNGVTQGNSDSIVTKLNYLNRSFLLTGDIEAATEQRLIARGIDLRSDVVKVAHHGSRTSSVTDFVEATNAAYAIVPVGLNSPYGHPHPEVVDRWKKNGTSVVVIGENGTTTVSTDGYDLSLETYLGEPKIQKPDRSP
jgi:competence protein ComEC